MELSPHTRLAGERLQPARPSLRNRWWSAGNMCFPDVDLISSLQHRLPAVSLLSDKWFGGGSRIRTHGGVTLNGFQDRRFRPLSHPSRTTALFLPPAALMVNQFVGLHSVLSCCSCTWNWLPRYGKIQMLTGGKIRVFYPRFRCKRAFRAAVRLGSPDSKAGRQTSIRRTESCRIDNKYISRCTDEAKIPDQPGPGKTDSHDS